LIVLATIASAGVLVVFRPFASLVYRKLDRVRVTPLRRLFGLQLDASSGVGTLSRDELDALVALGDALYPTGFASDGPLGVESRRTTEEKIDRLTTREPGYRDEFRWAVRFLDEQSVRMMGERFARASLDQRRELLNEVLGPIVPTGYRTLMWVCLFPSGRRRWRLWRYVCAELLMGFYRSSLGWRIVGYPIAPGTCSDLVAYQYPPNR
jgi:hypothetical protein